MATATPSYISKTPGETILESAILHEEMADANRGHAWRALKANTPHGQADHAYYMKIAKKFQDIADAKFAQALLCEAGG